VLIVVSFQGCADGHRGEQAAHVLDDDQLRLQRVDRCGHVCPEAGAGAGCEAGASAGDRYVLTGESTTEHIDGFDVAPVDGGDVAEVRGVRPVVGEDAGDGLVDFGEPDRLRHEGVFDSEVEPAVPGEE